MFNIKDVVFILQTLLDYIEPELIKTKADETFEGYKETAIQLIQNPLSIIELAAQSVSDTVETEGMAYVTGGALTALIPASFGVKAVKGGAGLKGLGKTKVDKSPYSKEFTQGKIDAALAGLGNVKVPVFYKEKLSTGPSDITSIGVEMKSLSEVRPQLFAWKDKGVTNSEEKKFIIKDIKHTEHFKEGAIAHILEGEINSRGKAVGFHSETVAGSNGKVIQGTESPTNKFGVYEAQVEINGINKISNNGKSTFFPKDWDAQKIVDAINQAYNNKVFVPGSSNTYRGTTADGMIIEMYIDKNGKIISAFPKYP